MAVTLIGSTTFAAAVSKDDTIVTLAALTGISKGVLLVHNGEAMLVRATIGTTQASVKRSYQGSKQIPHANGARVFYGAPDTWKSVRDNAVALVGDSAALPDYCMPGVRAFDAQGNEYVMVEMTQTVVPGATVLISKDGNFTAAVLTTNSLGPVGITAEGGSSDQYIWVQIYGWNAHAKLVGGSSLGTSVDILSPATSVSTPAVGLVCIKSSTAASSDLSNQILGMFMTGAVSTASTSATSETGYFAPVWLNYPYLIPTSTTS